MNEARDSVSVEIEYKGITLRIPEAFVSGGKRKGTDDGCKPVLATSVSTDTRTIEPGALFFALSGEKFDGHEYAGIAAGKGAAAIIVEQEAAALFARFPKMAETDALVIEVSSALETLQDLAKQYRSILGIPVVGVTGSNGKTTTKNLVAAVLSKKYKTAATRGNLNNHIGLPLSILHMDPSVEMGVFEAGINHVGEMAPLSEIMQPDAVVVTNIGTAHIEYFGSKEAIAREKGLLGDSSPVGAKLFIPASEQFAATVASSSPQMELCKVDQDEAFLVEVADLLEAAPYPYFNAPHVMADALLAASVGHSYSISAQDIADAIVSTKIESGRFDVHAVSEGLIVIDDTYNANPDSVIASLEAAKSMYPDDALVLVLGSLKEQGEFLSQGYSRILETASELEVKEVFLVGIEPGEVHGANQPLWAAPAPRAHYFSTKQLCLDILTTFLEERAVLKNGQAAGANPVRTVVLVKGSRSAQMEEVVAVIAPAK
ncbi:MAG TPA: UDP-N-acetylmuramoyl-tripeptide--D-alanyl-D-alanine ligase [Candidatus Paceibacterota bacterium]